MTKHYLRDKFINSGKENVLEPRQTVIETQCNQSFPQAIEIRFLVAVHFQIVLFSSVMCLNSKNLKNH